ncbi:unnamed protein product [Neospora caninum Liverpool]|uniref:AP2 domain transcription factor AP2X-5 n=1 Tax=Neospora caninum (strain Liverpool) TaxID=572307 RepID=F0VKR9_NEOCL|nr:uncharacterized protein NCLIV_050970 [Neospora caninum Liverpool]CBZ54670.1 unnamed protein product [Neospora caninum Liverpool]CEL69386.1 TPA: AP2 domain transcription factor AP2X-5 [Neospora caninum Liverpool]|eukprot:XP_003884700.1 uncharacterized protein NCLIV_050970 [Neospora caninum Liverpool]
MATFQIDSLDMGSEPGVSVSHALDRSPFPFTIFNSSSSLRREDNARREELSFYSSHSASRDQASCGHSFSGQHPSPGCSTTGATHYQDDGRNAFLHSTPSQAYPSALAPEFSFSAEEARSAVGYCLPNMQREHGGSCSESGGVDPSRLVQPCSSNQYSSGSQPAPLWFQTQAPPAGDSAAQSYGYVFPASQGVAHSFSEDAAKQKLERGDRGRHFGAPLSQLSSAVSDTSCSAYTAHYGTNASVICNPQERDREEDPDSPSYVASLSFPPVSQGSQGGEAHAFHTSATRNGMRKRGGEDSTGEAATPGEQPRQGDNPGRSSDFGTENSLKAAAEELYSKFHLSESVQRHRPSLAFGHNEGAGKGKTRAHPYSLPGRSACSGWPVSSVPAFSLPRSASVTRRQAEKEGSGEQEEREVADRLTLGDCLQSGFPLSSDMRLAIKGEGAGPSSGGSCRLEGYTLSRKPTESTTHPSFSSSSSQSFSPPLSSSRGSPRLEPKAAPVQLPEEERERGAEENNFLGFVLPPRQEQERHGASLFSGALQMQMTVVGEGEERQATATRTAAPGEQRDAQGEEKRGQGADNAVHAQPGPPVQAVEDDAERGHEGEGQGASRECFGADRQAEDEGDANRRSLEGDAVTSTKRKRGSPQPAKMYFHKKKEAWRAEVLIDGTKRQKSFSCKMYGEPRARMLCEWARRFARDFGRLPSNQDVANYIPCLSECPPAPRSGSPAESSKPEGSPYPPSFSFSSGASFPENDADKYRGSCWGNPSPPAAHPQGVPYGNEGRYPFFSNASPGVPDGVHVPSLMHMSYGSSPPHGQSSEFSSFPPPERWREMDAREMWAPPHSGREGAGNIERTQTDKAAQGRADCPYSPYGQMPQPSFYPATGMERPQHECWKFPVQAEPFPTEAPAWSSRPEAFSGDASHQVPAWPDSWRREDGTRASETVFSSGPAALGWPPAVGAAGEDAQRRFAGAQDARSRGVAPAASETHEQGGGFRGSPPEHCADANAPSFARQPLNAAEAVGQERMRREREERMRLGGGLAGQPLTGDGGAGQNFSHLGVSGSHAGPGTPGGPRASPPQSVNASFQMYAPSGGHQPEGSPQVYPEEARASAQYPQTPEGKSAQQLPSTSCPPSPFSSSTCAGTTVASFPSSSGSAGVPASSLLPASADIPFSPFPSPFISDGPFPPVPFSSRYRGIGDEAFLGPSYSVSSGEAPGSRPPCDAALPYFPSRLQSQQGPLPFYPSPASARPPPGPSTDSGMFYHASLSSVSPAFYGPQVYERAPGVFVAGHVSRPLLSAVELAADVAAMSLFSLEKQSFESLVSQTLEDLKREEGAAASAPAFPSSVDGKAAPSFSLPLPLLLHASSLLDQMEDPFSGFSLDPWGQAFAAILPATSDYQRPFPSAGTPSGLPHGRPTNGGTFIAAPEAGPPAAADPGREGANAELRAQAVAQAGQNKRRTGGPRERSVGDPGKNAGSGTDSDRGRHLGAAGDGRFGEQDGKEESRNSSACGDADAKGFTAFVQKRREMNIAAGARFEELDGLKNLTRPRGGRTKRFNVGKKPFSGVRGIYFQQGAWKVRYRGDQEEVLKVFPYVNGDFDSMWVQFSLARQFLRQVIAKGRQLHDSDGEGLSDEEPAWILRRDAASANSASRRAELGRSRRGHQSSSRSSSLSASQPRQGSSEASGADAPLTSSMRTRRHELASADGLGPQKGEAPSSPTFLGPRGVSGPDDAVRAPEHHTGELRSEEASDASVYPFLPGSSKPQERQAGRSQGGGCSRRLEAAVESLRPISRTDFFEPIFFPALFGPTSEKWGARAESVKDEVKALEQKRCAAAPELGRPAGVSGDASAELRRGAEKKRGSEDGVSRDCLSPGDSEAAGEKASCEGVFCQAREKRRKVSESGPGGQIPELCATQDPVEVKKDAFSELGPIEGACGSRKETEEAELEETPTPSLGCGASVSSFPRSFGSPFAEEGSASPHGEKECAESRSQLEGDRPATPVEAFEALARDSVSDKPALPPTPLSREKEFQLVASYPWDVTGALSKGRAEWQTLPHLPLLLQDRHDRVLASSFSWSF